MCVVDNDGANCLAVRLPSREKGYEQELVFLQESSPVSPCRCWLVQVLLPDHAPGGQ